MTYFGTYDTSTNRVVEFHAEATAANREETSAQ